MPKLPFCLPSIRTSLLPRTALAAGLALAACGAEPDGELDTGDDHLVQRCSYVACGNGIVEAGELCDDGNFEDDDGCDTTCQPSGLAAVSTGDATTCAVTLAGNVKCWGRGDGGQLGRANTESIGDDELPVEVSFVYLGATADQIYTNGEQGFALLDNGTVRAFGVNTDGELGLGHTESIGDDEYPGCSQVQTDLDLGGAVDQLAVGEGFACALDDAGTVTCWGRGEEGQLGYGSLPAPSEPVEVELGGVAEHITAGGAHACALMEGGAVRCWGSNDLGQLGLGHRMTIGDDETPAEAGEVALGGAAVHVAAGRDHTCALMDTGAVRCWGANGSGQLGYGNPARIGDDEDVESAGEVRLGGLAQGLVAGEHHTCALLEAGTLRCWGDSGDGRLGASFQQNIGDDEFPSSVAEVDFGGAAVTMVFGGSLSQHTCVLLEGGRLRCWGANDRGQLGLGLTTVPGETEGSPGDLPDVIVIEDPNL